MALAAPGRYHVSSSRQGVKGIFAIFMVFRTYLEDFSTFFHEIFMVARLYRVRATLIKSLLISALDGLKTRLKVSILVIF